MYLENWYKGGGNNEITQETMVYNMVDIGMHSLTH